MRSLQQYEKEMQEQKAAAVQERAKNNAFYKRFLRDHGWTDKDFQDVQEWIATIANN